MSEWYEAEVDDIDIDFDGNEVDIFVKQNEFGRVYVSLTFEQIKDICNEINRHSRP
jgi:hypothetical protein